jgi:multisubunit Na+/H+ antiporter MnhB subunit
MSDKISLGEIGEIIVIIILFVSFSYIILNEPFPASEFTHKELIPRGEKNLGGAMSDFLWDFRGFDLIFQSLVLFTTAIACLAMLREEILR